MDQRAAERSYGIAENELTPGQGWSLASLRKTWNVRKGEYAPWWAENSKEAYNTGLDALARGLDAWSRSRKGERAGKAVGFPRFKTSRARRSARFTTGSIRVETDRHHVTLPRVGTIKTHESTRKLARRIEAGTARVLSATVTLDSAGRTAAQARLRALQRKAARRHGPYDPGMRTKRPPSKRWQRTQARIGNTHARAANVRRDVLHKATTVLAQQHQVVVVETLNASGMRSAGGACTKGLNRALADAALAEIRRMLAYKTRWYGSTLVEADRYYPSSKMCSACGGRKPNLTLADRRYVCQHCGLIIDRDLNAAINLARLIETHTLGEQSPAGSGSVAGRGATRETEPARAGDAGGREASTPHNPSRVGQTGTVVSQGTAA
jgi:putative transposase